MTAADYRRQEGLVPAALRRVEVLILGAGTTGSWFTLQLAKMGFESVMVMDADKVEPHNLPAQVYAPGAVGEAKVRALARGIRLMTGLRVRAIPEMFTGAPGQPLLDEKVVFMCADAEEGWHATIDGWRAAMTRGRAPRRIIDVRVAPEGGSVVFCPPTSVEDFERSLFGVTYTHSECGARALCSNAAAITGAALTMWLAGERGDRVLPERVEWNFRAGFVEEVRAA